MICHNLYARPVESTWAVSPLYTLHRSSARPHRAFVTQHSVDAFQSQVSSECHGDRQLPDKGEPFVSGDCFGPARCDLRLSRQEIRERTVDLRSERAPPFETRSVSLALSATSSLATESATESACETRRVNGLLGLQLDLRIPTGARS